MEPGFLTVIGLAVMVVVTAIFPELSGISRTLSPVEQNLTRAANGFAVMVLSAAAFWWFPGLRSEFNHLEAVIGNPAAHWPVITAAALVLFGLWRFVSGARQCRGACVSGPLAGRAFLTMALAFAGGWLLWHRTAPHDFWMGLGWLTLLIMCCWWTCTGFIRFVLLNWPQGNPAKILVADDIDAGEFQWPGERGGR